MYDEEPLTPAEGELESALGALRPAGVNLDRDQTMFLAGQASVRRCGRLWQGATVALALALGVSVAARPAPRQVERIVYVTRESPVLPAGHWASADPLDRSPGFSQRERDYLRLRDEVLAHGLDALSLSVGASGASGGHAGSVQTRPAAPERTPVWQGYRGSQALKELGEQL